MKATDLDTKDVTVTRTEKRYVLNEKVFELDGCPEWAQYAAVDQNGMACWYSNEPYVCTSISKWWADKGCAGFIYSGMPFDATNWQNSLIKRPKKVLEVTMTDLEKKFGCKVKIVREN